MSNESKKEAEEKSANQSDSTDEKKDKNQEDDTSSKNEDSKEQGVTLTKEEHEKLQKKAEDFDGIIEKQRLEKLRKKEEKSETTEGETKIDTSVVKDMIQQEIQKVNVSVYNRNLEQALKKFSEGNKWAETKIDDITDSFDPGNALTEEDILAKLELTAQTTYPVEYKSAMESKIKSEILAEKSNIDAGDSGTGGGSVNKDAEEVNATKEDQRIADKFFGGDVKRYLASKSN
jgi:hypothetical protein